MNWHRSAAEISWDIRPFVNGRYESSSAPEHFESINPAKETRLCHVIAGNAADIDKAVRAARLRFEQGCWSQLPPVRRADILRKLADLLLEHKAELALLDTLEMGKPIREALSDIEGTGSSLLRSCAAMLERLLGEAAPVISGNLSFNVYEPRGVIGAITPWNFPLVNAVVKVGPALAAGNSVVLKPSELSASSALRLAELALEAGLPEGVLNVVPGLGSTVGAALASHPDVNLLSFTGSTATGRKIMELSGRSNGKPLLSECGGKSPHVVFSDVQDLDTVADAAVAGLTWNQGQVCSAHTRLIVQEDIKDVLLEKVVMRAARCKPGDPLDEATTFGPLASRAQRARVKAYIDQGLQEGARALLKGEIQERNGCFVSPTIFDRVERGMSIVREEIFGPVLCVQSFGTEAEALALANGTDYGLAATVWTRDAARSRRLAHAIKAGFVSIRTSGEEGLESGCTLSFEPQRASGFGSEFGVRGLESYSTLKSINMSGA